MISSVIGRERMGLIQILIHIRPVGFHFYRNIHFWLLRKNFENILFVQLVRMR